MQDSTVPTLPICPKVRLWKRSFRKLIELLKLGAQDRGVELALLVSSVRPSLQGYFNDE